MKNAERLKAHLKKLGLSCNKAARVVGVADVTFWRYTAGMYNPTRKVRAKIKRKLDFEWKEDE